ncbi:MAG: hypothetical protein STHCBS139747_003939 [Sporothrix thermara]
MIHPTQDRRLVTTIASTTLAVLLTCLAAAQLPAVEAHDDAFAAVAVAAKAASSSSDQCPANYYSCANQGSDFDGICCPYDQVCSLAENGRPACCPSGDICTGGAPSTYVTTTAAASYVPNAYYPSFPYLLPADVVATTALADVHACNAVLSQCSRTFAQCTTDLEGGNVGGGVTVVVAGSTTLTRGGGGPAATALGVASAASICSSLSSEACGGLPADTAGCVSLFNGRADVTGFSTGNSGGARQQRLPPRGRVAAVAACAMAVAWMAF